MYRPKANEARNDIPYIDVHNCHEAVDYIGLMTKTGEPFPWAMPKHWVGEATQEMVIPTFKQIRGAFEYKLLYCPLREEEYKDDEGNKMKRLVEDDSTKPSLVDKDGLKYWARTRSAREIVEMAAVRYPKGCWLMSRGSEQNMKPVLQYLDFNALLKLGAFLNGGSATGISLQVVELMIAVSKKADKRENGWDSDIRGRISGLGGAIRKWIAKSSLKKLGQGPKVHVSGKVSTSHSMWVTPAIIQIEEEGQEPRVVEMPVVCFNPYDDMVKLLGISEGDIVTFGRTPTVFRGYALARFSEEVAIGGVEISAEQWAIFNRGDGDGDPEDSRNDSELMGINDNVQELFFIKEEKDVYELLKV